MGNTQSEIAGKGVTLIDCNDGQFTTLVWFHPVQLYDGKIGTEWFELDPDDVIKIEAMVDRGEAIQCRVEEWQHEAWGEQLRRSREETNVAHRIYGPAFLLFEETTGKIVREEFFNNGYRHRPAEEGPALRGISHLTDVAYHEEYHVAGYLHNPNGPAVIDRDPRTGEVVSEEFYIWGEKVQPFNSRYSKPATPEFP